MKWKRTAMSLALAGCMMATTVPVTAFAAQTTTVASEQAVGNGDKLASFGIAQSNYTVAEDNTVAVSAVYELAGSYTSIQATNIEWTISDTEIATIGTTSGQAVVVTGKKAGTTTLTATFGSEETKEWTATCTITVTEKQNSTEITLDKTSATLVEDDTDNNSVTLKASLNGTEQNKTITWKSTNVSVAQVNSNGKVTAVSGASGTAEIYASVTVKNDNDEDVTLTSTPCLVTVTSKAKVLGSVVVAAKDSEASSSLDAGDTLELKATLADKNSAEIKNSSATVVWKSSNDKVATVDQNGVVTAVAKGTAAIYATATLDGVTVTSTGYAVTVDDAKTVLTGAKISAKTAAIEVDQVAALSVTTTPADATVKSTSWEIVSGESYIEEAKDDDNNVIKGSYKGKAAGTAIVKVTVVGYDAEGKEVSYNDSCAVTVRSASATQVATLTINDIDAQTANASKELTASLVAAKNADNTTVTLADSDIKWSVTPASVAKIVDGYVVFVGEGNAVLTAEVNGVTATKNITVNKATTKVSSMKYTTPTVAMTIGQEDVTNNSLKVFDDKGVVISNTDDIKAQIVYTSSNESVVAVANKADDVKKGTVKGELVAVGAGSATITATYGSVSATYTVSVVDPKAPVATGFVDVPANAWYADAVNDVAAKGLMNGTGSNKFEPLKTVDRAQVATIVWNMAGSPAATGTTPFTDVASNAWYAQSVTWAYQNKVVAGTSATTFAPAVAVTRQDFASMLYRYAGSPAATADLSKFTDASAVSSYATDAVKWAVSKGIISGNEKSQLNPKGQLTRAEAASIISRYTK